MTTDVNITEGVPSLVELVDLYTAVGWTAYTRDPDTLNAAFDGSTLVLTARGADGLLCGIARALSDGVTVCYVQDLVVDPRFQRQGIGASLMRGLISRYAGCRQVFLTTDADGPLDFYRGLGFIPHGEQGLVALGRAAR